RRVVLNMYEYGLRPSTFRKLLTKDFRSYRLRIDLWLHVFVCKRTIGQSHLMGIGLRCQTGTAQESAASPSFGVEKLAQWDVRLNSFARTPTSLRIFVSVLATLVFEHFSALATWSALNSSMQ